MKEIRALPSVINCDDGSRRELGSFSPEEKAEILEKTGENISR